MHIRSRLATGRNPTCFISHVLSLTLSLGMAAGAAQAQSIETVGVSPDGSTVLVGGTNRVLYTLDPAAMEVTGRRYVPELVEEIIFAADGATVYLRDNANRLVAHATTDMSVTWQAEDADAVAYDAGTGRIAVLDKHWDNDSLRLLDAATGAQAQRVALGKMNSDMLALAEGAGQALVLTQAARSDTEEKADPPDGASKLEQALHKQKTDGYVSQVLSVDLDNGEMAAAETFFRTSYPHQTVMLDGQMMLLRGPGDSGRVAMDGSAEMVDLGDDYFNFAMIDAARETYILTNGSKLRFVPVAGGSAEIQLDAGSLPGGPTEWVTAGAEGADGTLYFGTNAYRVFKVPPDRGSVTAVAVY